VNVQIVGLNYAKPRLGGPSKWAGYKTEKECKREKFVFFIILDRPKRWTTKARKKSVKSSRIRIRNEDRAGRVGRVGRVRRVGREGRAGRAGWDRSTNLKGQISLFSKIVQKLWGFLTITKKWVINAVTYGYRSINVNKMYYQIVKVHNNSSTKVYSACKNEEETDVSEKSVNCNTFIIEFRKIQNIMYNILFWFVYDKCPKGEINKQFNISYSFSHSKLANKVYIKCIIMIMLTIVITLVCHGVERNPGPPKEDRRGRRKMEIITYNCNGLGDQKKLRRLLLKANKKVQDGAIIFLQETHIVNTDYIKSIWKNKFISNCIKTNSAGVIILYNNKYELKLALEDKDGRMIVAVLKSDDSIIIGANAYFPNDHREGMIFAENLYLKILEAQSEYPDSLTICAGDFNTCISDEDSMGRNKTNYEKLLADVITNNNKVAELFDAYRLMHRESGYTWKRGTIYSRLDYIFISKSHQQKLTSAETNWAFETSDHAAVSIEVLIEEPQKGPGITKIDCNLMNDPIMTKELGTEMVLMMDQVSKEWNPHLILEFLKVTIRSTFALKAGEQRRTRTNEIGEKEEELNQVENLKIKLLKNININIENKQQRLSAIEEAITTLRTSLQNLRSSMSAKMSFASSAKWSELGEKSNKYFLNLNKTRQSQKLISEIKNGDEVHVGQSQVVKGITNFYRALYTRQRSAGMNDDKFYENCPKLTDEQATNLDSELTLNDLHKALSTCKDSAPGPDGIPYSVYKTYWPLMGPIILEAWKYSLKVGKLPPSHLESAITLLPKDGKDTRDIKNWRPITLSNCDSKIITKALALKTSKVLDSIIDPSQTAYVPGRSITDNLRSNFYYKNYCHKHNVNSVLISLDAKKAFDSVSHDYIEETLTAYGFGPVFLQSFRVLYRDITARILINGFYSEAIKIERGVKQGDALSCSIFIICIDPLLRNINKNKNIKEIQIKQKNRVERRIFFKGAAYADDISVVCQKDLKSIQMVFTEYERLTRRSGLELNADKTEILSLNPTPEEQIPIQYNDNFFEIKTVDKLKICGLYYCTSLEDEYKFNIFNKIDKLRYNLKAWSHRNLTLEGKTLVVKTFGLSQIIYNLQAYGIDKEEVTSIERIIFKFLWSTKDNQNGIDRIKRSIMKNEFSKGGMNVTDVECLNRALKLKQFIRAQNSKHIIATIQAMCTTREVGESQIKQEYAIITEDEPICRTAQETMNLITDHNRNLYNEMTEAEYESDRYLIDEVSTINLLEYLKRKGRVFMLCLIKPLISANITTLGELTLAYEYENNNKIVKTMKLILSNFPQRLIEVAKCSIEGINARSEEVKYIMMNGNNRTAIDSITVKEIQITLKAALNKTENLDVNAKHGITNFEESNITEFRKICKNAKLRNIYFRLIHNDFFTHVKMKRNKMTDSDSCPRCGIMETLKHLIWECSDSLRIWEHYNQIMTSLNEPQECVNLYEDIFRKCENSGSSIIKIRIVQAMIQIARPTNWDRNKVTELIKDLVVKEKYNSLIYKHEKRFTSQWLKFVDIK
jgi:exonuclease III